jgi:hypothetical protein
MFFPKQNVKKKKGKTETKHFKRMKIKRKNDGK